MEIIRITRENLDGLDISRYIRLISALSDTVKVEMVPKILDQITHNDMIHLYIYGSLDDPQGHLTLLIEPKVIHGRPMAHIEDVVVSPLARKNGIGRCLVEHAIHVAKHLGCYKVILNCTKEVSPFYEKIGFHQHSLGMRLDFDL